MFQMPSAFASSEPTRFGFDVGVRCFRSETARSISQPGSLDFTFPEKKATRLLGLNSTVTRLLKVWPATAGATSTARATRAVVASVRLTRGAFTRPP